MKFHQCPKCNIKTRTTKDRPIILCAKCGYNGMPLYWKDNLQYYHVATLEAVRESKKMNAQHIGTSWTTNISESGSNGD